MRRALPVLLAALAALSAPALGQPLAFGSSDDPLELGSEFRPADQAHAAAYVGPAYLPDAWRGAARAEVEALRGRLSVGVGATVHSGDGGLYGPEDDELVDLARAVRYVRYNATASSRAYARLGPTEQVSLGVGALVRRYRTTTAWDERRIGAEAAVEGRAFRAAGFVDDVLRLNGVVGGEVGVATGLRLGPLDGVGVTVGAVHDLGQSGLTGDSSLTGVEVTVRGVIAGDRPLALRPFATHARYLGRGSTLGAGVEVGSPNLGDALRPRARLAVFANTARFVPGPVGPFYALSNRTARIVDDGAFFDAAEENVLAGTPLDSLSAGVDVVLDLKLVAFGRFEVSQYVRRHVGDETASGYSLRLAARLPRQTRVEFGLERQDFRGFFDLVQDLGDLNALVLDVRAPLGRRGVVFVRSRYGYRRLTDADGYAEEPQRYLVERRFEPLVGVRFGG